MEWAMEPVRTLCNACIVQHILRGRIFIPWRIAPPDEWCFWKMGLGCQWHSVLVLPFASTLGHSGGAARQPDLCLERKELPQQLVPYHFAFRAKHLLFISDPGSCAWIGIDWRNGGGLP